HGERDLAVRVEKVNRYSSGLVGHKRKKRVRLLGLRLVFYPAFVFLRFYVAKRYFLNGWAGFLAARVAAFYAFLKYAKVLEAQQLAALEARGTNPEER
ncbi:MAG: glycosyltransferase family 2 protein, partial [Arenimonas sp.]